MPKQKLPVVTGIALPVTTPLAESVPKGGSCCNNCEAFDHKNGVCMSDFYIQHEGTNKIGDKPKKWCCCVWIPEGGR